MRKIFLTCLARIHETMYNAMDEINANQHVVQCRHLFRWIKITLDTFVGVLLFERKQIQDLKNTSNIPTFFAPISTFLRITKELSFSVLRRSNFICQPISRTVLHSRCLKFHHIHSRPLNKCVDVAVRVYFDFCGVLISATCKMFASKFMV